MKKINIQDKQFLMIYNDSFVKASSKYYREIKKIGPESKNWLALIEKYKGLQHFEARFGEFPNPWKTYKDETLVTFDPTFNKTYAEVSDSRAMDIKRILDESEAATVTVFWSGGVDSTVVLSSLLRNLGKPYYHKIRVALNPISIAENPIFYDRYLKDSGIVLLNSVAAREHVSDQNHIFLDGELNDQHFGSDLLCQFVFNEGVDYAHQPYKKNLDKIFKFLEMPQVPTFAGWFYEHVEENIKTSPIPIETIHDYFWWLNFNFKYVNVYYRYKCISLTESYNAEKGYKEINDTGHFFHWFHSNDYQQWSMHNNNNGMKLRDTVASYKYAAKEYLYEFDKNRWYKNFKPKMGSLINMTREKEFTTFGITRDNAIIEYDKHDDELFEFTINSFKKFESR